jgi:membrane fusion protein
VNVDVQINTALKEKRSLLEQEKTIQLQQLRQRALALTERHRLMLGASAKLKEETALQTQRVASMASVVARYRALREQGFVSDMQFIQIENEYLEQLARSQTLERTKLDSARELADVDAEAELIRNQVSISNVQLQRAHADADHESAEQQAHSRSQVLAPATGTITALTSELGESINAGGSLANIVPKGSALQAHLIVPSHAIGFLAAGQSVWLRIAAFPYQKFGYLKGSISQVEQSPIAEQVSGASPNTEQVYRITVDLAQQSVTAFGKRHQLRPGMQLDADIRQEQRRLIEWFFMPLWSAARDIAS